jgi:glycogen operon protein
MLNMFWKPLDFEVPGRSGRAWRRAIDTSAASPHDIVDAGQEAPVADPVCTVQGRSIVVLVGRAA